MALHDLLKAHRLIQHPFSTWKAEDEEKVLEKWFIRPPFFEDLLGTFGIPQQEMKPSSHIVFGTPGGGKTALRKMVEAELLSKADRSLIMRYTDFSRVLTHEIVRPTLEAHVDELMLLGTIGLLAFWIQHEDRYSSLSTTERAELAGLVYTYYDKLPSTSNQLYTTSLSPYAGKVLAALKTSEKTIVDTYNAMISVFKKERIEPTSWAESHSDARKANPVVRLQRFWSLAKAMGIKSIWVLGDGVDEHASVKTDEAIFTCVAELLLNQQIIEFRDQDRQVMCFKVFLTRPEGVEPMLEKHKFRKDRIPIKKIEWRRSELDLAFKRRLAYYSADSVLSFDDICGRDLIGTHDRLLDECGLRPRTLFYMAYEILASFQRLAKPGESKLDKESIDEGIRSGKAAAI